MNKGYVMELFEQLLEDYAHDAEIQPNEMHRKISAGLVYWEDLDLKTLNLEHSTEVQGRINKTAEMQELLKSLNQLVMQDSLTGLYNRRYFDRAFKSEMERSARENRTLGLAIIDIDHFKQINDTWGHDGGDVILKATSNRMLGNIRQSDTLIRIGGEEFAVLMPNIRHNVAEVAMERLRKDIEGHILEVKGTKINISVSIGVAVRESNQILPVEELYKKADEALYKAKQTGRNKVVLYDKTLNIGLTDSEREALAL